MVQFWKDVGIAFTMGFLLPAVLLGAIVSLTANDLDVPTLTEPIIISDSTEVSDGLDSKWSVSVEGVAGQVFRIPLREYLAGVVLSEMPVSFEAEALKAQAVVARTYTMRALTGSSKHEDATLCIDPACCQGYVDVVSYIGAGGKREDVEYIKKLISETDGLVITYGGTLIEATYFSCSGGVTEDAVAVWGSEVPYLQSVTSPGEEEAIYYTDTVIYTKDELAARLGVTLGHNPALWVSDVTYTNGGGVATMTIGGERFTGTEVRKLLDLRSTAFTIVPDGAGVIIQTRGYGHRVGMSQYGADAMAAVGCTFEEILSHYYVGTKLTPYAD